MVVILLQLLPQMMACRSGSALRSNISQMHLPSRTDPQRWWLPDAATYRTIMGDNGLRMS